MLPHLPQTDSRLRPDLRALEFGDYDLAEKEKCRLEDKQRRQRKLFEQQGVKWKPLWFDRQDPNSSQVTFNNKYWKCREEKNWPQDQLDIFT